MSARQKHTDSVLMDPALSNEQNEIMFKHVFAHTLYTERGLKGILLSKWLTKRTTTHIITTPPPLSLSLSLSLSISFLFSF